MAPRITSNGQGSGRGTVRGLQSSLTLPRIQPQNRHHMFKGSSKDMHPPIQG